MTPAPSDSEALLWKARTALDDANDAFAEERWENAVNRAYYAAFRAASAMLATRDLAFSKHAAVVAEFNRLFVHTGMLPKTLGRDLNRLFELRQAADYDFRREMNARLAREAIEKASGVVDSVERTLARGADTS